MSDKYSLFFCKWKNCEISGVAARNCDYCNLEDYICRHTGEPCVAKAGLEQFAQSLAESAPSTILSADIFQQTKGKVEIKKRQATYQEIAKMWTDKHGDD